MAGYTLNGNSALQCPHGGTVQVISSNTRVRVDGGYAATSTDTFMITGCPFQIPAAVPIPSPCVRVQWIVPDTRVRVNGSFSLSQGSTGLCMSAMGLPQGPVVVANTQTKSRSM